MLALRYLRPSTAGRAVSVAPTKLAGTLILIFIFVAFGLKFAVQGCHSQKSSDSPSLELTKDPPTAQGGRESIDTIVDASETVDRNSKLLFMRTAGPGGSNSGRLTSDRDGDR